MLKKRMRKLASVMLSMTLVATLQVPTAAFAETGDGQEGQTQQEQQALQTQQEQQAQEVVPADLARQSMTELFQAGKVKADGAALTLATDEESESLVISGSRSKMLASTIVIDKEFDFGKKPIGRFSLAGFAAAGKRVKLGFFLDDAAEPFCQMRLDAQKRAGSWAYPDDSTQDVIAQAITGTHKLSIKVLDCSSSPSFSLKYVEFCQASVPVMNINIDESLGTIDAMNSAQNHEVNCYGSLSISVPQGATSAMTGKSLAGTNGELEMEYIRGRGNSTWDCMKKPYKIKLDSKENLLGMGKNKHWALLANAYDETQLRNVFTAKLGMALNMEFTVSMEPVELIMNGKYLGSYFLSEVVRVDNNRVEIDEIADDATTEPDVTGGYLLSLGNWSLDDDKLNFTTKRAEGVFQVESPDLYSSKNETQFNYIKDYVQQLEDAIYASNEDPDYKGVAYSELMDMESAVKYFWIQEASMNGDGFTSGSCYLYKKRGDKLYWGPIWDFDLAWSNAFDERSSVESWAQNTRFWNAELFKSESYVQAVKNKWPEVSAALAEMYKSGGVIDELADHIRVAAGYDYEKWGGDTGAEGDGSPEKEQPETVDPFAQLDKNVAALKTWVQGRADWIGQNLDSIKLEVVDVQLIANGKVWKTIQGNEGLPIGALPEGPAKKGYRFAGWEIVKIKTLEDTLKQEGLTEQEYRQMLIDSYEMGPEEADAYIESLRTGVEEREDVDGESLVTKVMKLYAKYVDESTISPVKKIYTSKDTYYGVYSGLGGETVSIAYYLVPDNVFLGDLTVASSDKSVVDATADPGYLAIKGAGECTVTLKAKSGASKTVKVHIYTSTEYEDMYLDGEELFLETEKASLEVGQYMQLKIGGFAEGTTEETSFNIVSTDESVVSVGSCGVIFANAPGTCSVVMVSSSGEVSVCRVTVTKPNPHVGTVVTRGGLKYQITSMSKSSRAVTCVGPASKKLTKATIGSTVTIKGKSYKVTQVAPSAFKGCSKLKTVVLGKNIQVVGAKAFYGCKKLAKVTFKSKLKPKVYSSAFKKTAKKLAHYVPKSQKKYYRIILGKKRVRTFRG